MWGTHIVRTGMLRVFGENLRAILSRSVSRRGTALGAGLVVTSVDGRRSFANTFEARFERQRPQLRILAARILLGE